MAERIAFEERVYDCPCGACLRFVFDDRRVEPFRDALRCAYCGRRFTPSWENTRHA